MPKRDTPDWSVSELRLLADAGKRVLNREMTWEEAAAAYFPGRTSEGCRIKHSRMPAQEEGKEGELSPHDLFIYLRDHPHTLAEICDQFGRSPSDILSILEKMEGFGYKVQESKNRLSITTIHLPAATLPEVSISDMMGKQFNIAVASDIHAGGRHSQPTSLNKFIQYVYKEYDVRHVFSPGDEFTGVYGYRGHEKDMIPSTVPTDRKEAWRAVDDQVWMADHYNPKLPDLTYYKLGGNHDYWHIKVAGRDGLRLLCNKRDDMVYCGYGAAGIPLTETAYVRMHHGTGGPSYARSYRVQKGIESLGFEALREAMREEQPPKTSILMMGHLHLTNFSPEPPLYGFLSGCFEGQTLYLKEKNLVPHIGGIIIGLKINGHGRVEQVSYTVKFFDEIKEDWKSWPVPQHQELNIEPDPLDTIYSAEAL